MHKWPRHQWNRRYKDCGPYLYGGVAHLEQKKPMCVHHMEMERAQTCRMIKEDMALKSKACGKPDFQIDSDESIILIM